MQDARLGHAPYCAKPRLADKLWLKKTEIKTEIKFSKYSNLTAFGAVLFGLEEAIGGMGPIALVPAQLVPDIMFDSGSLG